MIKHLMFASCISSLCAERDISCLDLNQFTHGTKEERREFARDFGKALEQTSCIAIRNSGIEPTLLDQVLEKASAYFKLPLDAKMRANTHDGLVGYTPFQQEHARDYPIGDLKEFYHVMGNLQPEHLWPQKIPQFKEIILAFYAACNACTRSLLEATALYLGCEENETILSDFLTEDTSILRLLHYPPVDESSSNSGAHRSHEHEDINLITIMPKASAPGLQVKTREGKWIDIIVPDHTIIVTPSDLLALISKQKIRAATHRVINPPQGDSSTRYSFPFFASPSVKAFLPVLNENGRVECFISYEELLDKRYKEINLKKG